MPLRTHVVCKSMYERVCSTSTYAAAANVATATGATRVTVFNVMQFITIY